jgi:acyl carrier protein
MTDAELVDIVTQALFSIAPDLEGEVIDFDVPLREQFEIDSMDFLNFVIALHKATGIEIPEKAYPELGSVSGAVAYLRAHASRT